MKLIKIIKYKLNEESLEKDIDKFIELAKKGNYHRDNIYGNEGLKIIKQYLKILNKKFKNNELRECKNCYHKLIPFLLTASNSDTNLFDYNDLLAKINTNFERSIENYFICLVKTCDINELVERVSNYASKLKYYGFDSDKEVLFKWLKKEELVKLEDLMLKRTEDMTKKDEDKREMLYFLLSLAEMQKDKKKYLGLCERFKEILDEKEIEFLKKEYEQDGKR